MIETKLKFLYHYTTLEAAYNILKSKTIRLSDLKKMNDSKEIIFVKECFFLAVEKAYNENSFEISIADYNNLFAIREIVNSAFNYLDIANVFNYAFCLTEKNDSLEQWLIYSNQGTGLNIGFEFEDLRQFAENNDFELIKVKYLNSENMINELLENAKQLITYIKVNLSKPKFKKFLNSFHVFGNILGMGIAPDYTEDFLESIKEISNIIEGIIYKAYEYKNINFLQENEWRLVTNTRKIIKKNTEKKIIEDYSIKTDNLVKFCESESFNCRLSINIGPKSKIDQNDIGAFLLGKFCANINKSIISIR